MAIFFFSFKKGMSIPPPLNYAAFLADFQNSYVRRLKSIFGFKSRPHDFQFLMRQNIKVWIKHGPGQDLN